MKTALIILSLVLLILAGYLYLDRDGLVKEKTEWATKEAGYKASIASRDSLILQSGLRFDSIALILDSARAAFPPPPVVIERAVRMMSTAKVDAVQDSLMNP